jgi:hypothetical protein
VRDQASTSSTPLTGLSPSALPVSRRRDRRQ